MSTDPTCPTCSGPVKPGRTYCSNRCVMHRPRGPKTLTKHCPECGTEFVHPAKRLKIYCSNPCRIVATTRLNNGRCLKKLHQKTVGRGRVSAFDPL